MKITGKGCDISQHSLKSEEEKKILKAGSDCHISSQKGLVCSGCILSSWTKPLGEETWPLFSPQIQGRVKGLCIFSALLLPGGIPPLTKESGGGRSDGSPASLGLGLADQDLPCQDTREEGCHLTLPSRSWGSSLCKELQKSPFQYNP